MIKVAHMVNPVKVSPQSDLYLAQPVTFASMMSAASFAAGEVDVLQVSTCFPEDKSIVPESFLSAPDLQRSVMDLASFNRRRKLPVAKDILDRLYACSEGADYLVYTNVDIGLQPYFYSSLAALIEAGYESFVVNRRTITDRYLEPGRLNLIYSQAGEPHCGYDCFVFPRNCYPRFFLGDACIGANWVGRALLANLLCTSKRFDVLEDCHMTFHLGDDRSWKRSDYADYDSFNNEQVGLILSHFESQGLLPDHALIQRFKADVLRKRKQYLSMSQDSGGSHSGGAKETVEVPAKRMIQRITGRLLRKRSR